jgi:ribosomal protein L11 methyltransferase
VGVGGMVMEDERDFRDFLENNRQYWDYVDESWSGVLPAFHG